MGSGGGAAAGSAISAVAGPLGDRCAQRGRTRRTKSTASPRAPNNSIRAGDHDREVAGPAGPPGTRARGAASELGTERAGSRPRRPRALGAAAAGGPRAAGRGPGTGGASSSSTARRASATALHVPRAARPATGRAWTRPGSAGDRARVRAARGGRGVARLISSSVAPGAKRGPPRQQLVEEHAEGSRCRRPAARARPPAAGDSCWPGSRRRGGSCPRRRRGRRPPRSRSPPGGRARRRRGARWSPSRRGARHPSPWRWPSASATARPTRTISRGAAPRSRPASPPRR